MKIKGDFATTAARVAYSIVSGDIMEAFRDLQDGEIYLAVRTGASANNWRSVSDISGFATEADLTAAEDDIATVAGDLDTAEAAIVTLQGMRIRKATLTVGHADLVDADGSQTIAFASALPATAVVLGGGVRVTTGFGDGGVGVFTADLGINGGDLDAILDGVALGTIANVGSPVGVRPIGMYGALTPALTVLADVNVVNATVGAAVAEVYYVEGANLT